MLAARLSMMFVALSVARVAVAQDLRPFRPVFDPDAIEALRAAATADVERSLAALDAASLERAARMFYAARDTETQPTWSDVELAHAVAAYRAEQVLIAVHAALKAAYPQQVVDKPIWIWNNVGGIYARMAIIACGLHEYLALFGTSTPQSGFSGYYPGMEVYDIMLTGSMTSWGAAPAAANPLVYTPGDRRSLLARKETRYYTMGADTYMLDYGRGNIARAFWQGVIAPYLFVNHDWRSLETQLGVCAEQVLPFLRGR
jgi:hypothetical protein